jgi:hypothetical protein
MAKNTGAKTINVKGTVQYFADCDKDTTGENPLFWASI